MGGAASPCPEGQIDCWGTCRNLQEDAQNCGWCGLTCGESSVCMAGVCTCEPGKTDCYGHCKDLSCDPGNCGWCGLSCGADHACQQGACVCPAGQTDCFGQCKDLGTDSGNCGWCGVACAGGHACSAGACVCPEGETDCYGECKDLGGDSSNCAWCGWECAPGETCEDGVCKMKPTCEPGLSECSGGCVDLGSDKEHCGACGKACEAEQECISGECVEQCVAPATSLRISSNFNGTTIKAGTTLWFNAVFNAGSACQGHVYFRDGKVNFSAGGVPYAIDLPDAVIEFVPDATTATTELNGLWNTRVPTHTSGNVFLTGVAWQVPVTLRGGINPVTMSGTATADCGPIPFKWKWAAAVYTCFDAVDPKVKAIDANGYLPFTGSEHAGTPMDSKSCVIGGARGGGGSNFTGSYSGTQGTSVEPCEEPCPAR